MLPLATSLDGRQFSFQASLHELDLQARRLRGARVRRAGAARPGRSGSRLEVRSATAADGRRAHPDPARAGRRRDPRRRRPPVPRRDAALRRRPTRCGPGRGGPPARARGWRSASSRWRRACRSSSTPAGFDRHTFLCGQSGSGKTYSLGLMLERLLAETELRLVILDPNSDYVRLGHGARRRRPGAGRALPRGRGRRRGPLRGAGAEQRLRLACAELEPDAQAALLRLDPIADRDEYAELAALLAQERAAVARGAEARASGGAPAGARASATSACTSTGIWARGEPGSVLDALGDDGAALPGRRPRLAPDARGAGADRRGRCSSGCGRRRARRVPMLIVIDEAHNVCPAGPRIR